MKGLHAIGICYLLLLFSTSVVKSQKLTLEWRFQTGNHIISSPLIHDQIVYVGSEDGNFYAIDAVTGKKLWHFTTNGRIQTTAVIVRNTVFFESGNVFYALHKTSGQEIWRFEPGSALWGYKIDAFDDKRSTPIVYRNVFYIGSSLGYIYGLDVRTGEKVFEFAAENQKPIRTTPLIHNETLYFGDWAGKIYAYDLKLGKLLWKKNTYDKKPYDSFGGIASELLIYNEKLFFGARNPEFQVLNVNNGEKVWSYLDPKGGWMIGDPVIHQDILYVGGSDNFKIFAFNPVNGEPIWNYESGLNHYTKAIVNQKHVIFTSGNAYKQNEPGKLIVIDRMDGTFVTEFEIPQGSFSPPALDGENIYFGAHDGVLYKLTLE